MKLHTVATTTLLVSALTIAGSAIAQATPGNPESSPMHYAAKRVGTNVLLDIDRGSFDVAHSDDPAQRGVPSDVVEVRDTAGTVADRIPLWYRLNGFRYPVHSTISADRHHLILTPIIDQAHRQVLTAQQARARLNPTTRVNRPQVISLPRATNIASPEENTLAQQNFDTQLDIASVGGTLVGTAIGVALGIPIGIVAAGAACLVGLLALIVGCFIAAAPAFLLVATVGGVLGTVVAGGGALVSSGLDLIQTLNAPPHTTHYQALVNQENHRH